MLHQLSQASLGNFGDCELVGEGVSEMRTAAPAPLAENSHFC